MFFTYTLFLILKSLFTYCNTVEALLNPPMGGYLISGIPDEGFIERGLISKGVYSQNQMTRLYMMIGKHS